MKKKHLFKYRLFSAIFMFNKAKMTSLSIGLLSLSKDFVPWYYLAKFGGNWTTNKGEAEGAHFAPITKYPIGLKRAAQAKFPSCTVSQHILL